MKVTVTLNIDFRMFKEQKEQLLAITKEAGEYSNLDGIINTMDAIQDQAAEQLTEEIVFPETGTLPTDIDKIKHREHLRMFDAYQHFLFYIHQNDIEKANLWKGHLTPHLITKLNGLRNRISPGCNSPEVVAKWIQEISPDNQLPLIAYILREHGCSSEKHPNRTKWGREI